MLWTFVVVFRSLLPSPLLPAANDRQDTLALLSMIPAGSETPMSPDQMAPAASSEPTVGISLQPGEIQSIPVDEIQRVVIGDPVVADVEVVSPKELFLQAKAVGTTNLMLWDQRGRRMMSIEVVSRAPEMVAAQLRKVIDQLQLADVRVYRERDKLFLTGKVSNKDDVDRLERLVSAFGVPVTNLVTVVAPPSAPSALLPVLPSVKLIVKVLEIDRDNKDTFGVKWNESLTFGETTFGAAPLAGPSLLERAEDAFRIGSISRSGAAGSLSAILNALVMRNKARMLAEPKLVAASGKDATTFLGVEVPVVTTTTLSSTGQTSSQNVEFKKTGVELKFKPTVLDDGHSIQLVIDAKVSSVDTAVAITVAGTTVQGFRIRQTQTEIVMDSGESLLISGLLQDAEKKNLSQVPGVGSIPVLGALFRSTQFTKGQTELVVIVTPEILAQRESAPATPTTPTNTQASSPKTVAAAGTRSEAAPKTPAMADQDQARMIEQALGRAESAETVANTPLLRYALRVQDRIAKAIRPPPPQANGGANGRVKLQIHVLRDGTLDHAMIAASSGVAVLDAEALRAAQSQSPYPPFPTELVQPDVWLELPIEFH